MSTSGFGPALKPGYEVLKEEKINSLFWDDLNPCLPKSVCWCSLLKVFKCFIHNLLILLLDLVKKTDWRVPNSSYPQLELPISTSWQWLVKEQHLTQFWPARYEMNSIKRCSLSKVFPVIERHTQEEMLFKVFFWILLYQDVISGTTATILLPALGQRQHTDDNANTWKEFGSLLTWLHLPYLGLSLAADTYLRLSLFEVWGLRLLFAVKHILKLQYSFFLHFVQGFFFCLFVFFFWSELFRQFCVFKPTLSNK